jgi:hypothetical protein
MASTMASVTIKAIVEEDRQLHIALPDEMPLGPVEITIKSVPEIVLGGELTREQARAILAAAGLLGTGPYPPGTVRLTEEEQEELGRLFGGEPDMATLISQDRDERWD